MDGATIQAKISAGYARAAKVLGQTYDVYRPVSLLTPLASANKIYSGFLADFTTGFDFSRFNLPKIPIWTALVDQTNLQIGDWFVGPQGTFYIADLQFLLPIPAVQCNRTITIVRPAYNTSNGATEQTNTPIATSFPVFMQNKRDKARQPAGFPAPTETGAAVPDWTFYINSHTVGEIKKNDVITDENGDKYVIDTPDLTSFGYIVEARIEKP